MLNTSLELPFTLDNHITVGVPRFPNKKESGSPYPMYGLPDPGGFPFRVRGYSIRVYQTLGSVRPEQGNLGIYQGAVVDTDLVDGTGEESVVTRRPPSNADIRTRLQVVDVVGPRKGGIPLTVNVQQRIRNP